MCPECKGYGLADVGGCPICGRDRRTKPWRRGFALILVAQCIGVAWAVIADWRYSWWLLVYYFLQFLTSQASRLR